MFGNILQRMIFFELVKVFALSLLGITGILVMAGIVAEASQQGLQPAQILMVIPLLIPSTLPYTIPATTLFATCVVYGRLSHDNEVLAIRAAGINVLQVVVPGAALGLLMSMATMFLYYEVIPTTHHMLRTQVLSDVEDFMYAMLRKDRCIRPPGLNYTISVRQVQGTRLIDALFKRQAPNGQYDIIAGAKEAELRVDLKNKQVLVHMKYCEVYGEGNKGRAYFDDKVWPVELPQEMHRTNPRPRAMSWPTLLETRSQLEEKQEAEEEARELALLNNNKADWEHRKNKVEHYKHELRGIDAEMHMRPAIAIGCLFFVLVGCPVGIWFSRSDYLSAFITCFLPIVLLYYPLLLCGVNLAKDNKLPAMVSIWIANGVLALLTPILFWRLTKN